MEEAIFPALYLVPSTLGDTPPGFVVPERNARIVRQIRHFIVESRKMAVRFLVKIDPAFPIDECDFSELSEHTAENADLSAMLRPLEKGEAVGVISDAGCPAVGDPGSRAAALAHKKGFRVVPLVGPNSMILSLMASGMNGQSFAFAGYLPAKAGEREKKIRQLEARAHKESQTQIFIETPYRNQKLFDAILKTCRAETTLCVAQGLTTESELIKTKTIAAWRKEKSPELGKIPAIFLLYK